MLFCPAPAQALTRSQLEVKHLIRHVFPVHYRAAQRVAYCESHYHRHAANGQHLGVFQLSESWRGYFRRLNPRWHDVAFTPSENIRAARAIVAGQGWAPWSCGWRAGEPSQRR